MGTNAKLRFGLWYDFRNPPAWRRPFDQLYGEIFDQIVWGEQHGFDDIWLSEHHFIDDGYSPSLLPIAAEPLIPNSLEYFTRASIWKHP